MPPVQEAMCKLFLLNGLLSVVNRV